MEPQAIGSDQWAQITRALSYLFLFTGLGLTAGLGFLLAHAILPSLIDSQDAPAAVSAVRWLVYPVAAVALVLAAYALVRALLLAVGVTQQIYPRMWI